MIVEMGSLHVEGQGSAGGSLTNGSKVHEQVLARWSEP